MELEGTPRMGGLFQGLLPNRLARVLSLSHCLEEMVSLVSATQNEIAKGAMDAWVIVLKA